MNTKGISEKILFRNDATIYDPRLAGEVDTQENYIFLKCDSDVITITPLMKEILEHARTPQTENEIATWVSIRYHCSYEKIYPSVNSFLNKMIKFGAVVPERELRYAEPVRLDEIELTKKFDDFVLLEQIGKNSSVTIYKCHRKNDPDNLYSIKILTGKDSKKYFFREAEILTSIPPHQNVRRCFQAAESSDGIPYLLLEFVDGKSLSDSQIKKELPIESKYKIGGGVLTSMHHLHAHGVLHGDIHASNFLVDINHEVHLIDLGMAFKEGEDAGHGGIPRYMPPERMPDHNYSFSKKKGDFISEVFQIGICLYLLFAGKYPFDGLLLKDLANNIKNNPPEPLHETALGEAIAAEVSHIIFKALEKEPQARYQSVLEMLNEWNKIINNIQHGRAIRQPIHSN